MADATIKEQIQVLCDRTMTGDILALFELRELVAATRAAKDSAAGVETDGSDIDAPLNEIVSALWSGETP